jgi:hypothetical protein
MTCIVDGVQWQVDLTTEEAWTVADVEMSETRAMGEASEENATPEVAEMEATEMEADVLTAACELIDAEVC